MKKNFCSSTTPSPPRPSHRRKHFFGASSATCVARSIAERAAIRRLKSRPFSPISSLQFRRLSDDPLAGTIVRPQLRADLPLAPLLCPCGSHFCHRFRQIGVAFMSRDGS
ncbi:hypothetical protein Salat_2550600 [Sesamum alatum]|uniref:Uncharacterized protein n=1 Tax=Sesamum alatum TaxID=300844 RepID=A0AAE1XSP2_9LAMI|nr:hypothetical protein Salat_2550600 [Sesamum alatum]